MEKEPQRESPKPESPKFTFRIGGKLFNLENILSPDYKTRKEATDLAGAKWPDRDEDAAWELARISHPNPEWCLVG